ncbi:hypothetical protein Tco_0117047 [Tanacetum coccineum]
MEGVVATWLIRNYRKQLEEYMEIKRRLEVNGINTNVECDPTNKRGDDEEVLTYDEFSDLEEENMHEGDETVEVFRIETDIFLFETPLCKEFKEFNHLLHIDVDVLTQDLPGFKTYEDYKNTCGHVEWPTCNWRDDGYYNEVDLPRVIREESFGNYHELDYELMLKLEEYWWGKKEEEESSEDAWSNYSPNDENKIIKMMPFKRIKNGFEYHEIMVDDDDIGGLDDYLIPKDEPYHVDEEGE